MIRKQLLVLALTLMAGCQPKSAATPDSHAIGQLVETDSTRLVVRPVKDAFRVGEPIRILVTWQTGDSAIIVRNLPQNYSYLVTGPNGDSLRSLPVKYESGIYGDQANLHVPRFGIGGQVVDLQCVADYYRVLPSDSRCMLRFDASRRGTYSIAVTFHGALNQDSDRVVHSSVARFEIQ